MRDGTRLLVAASLLVACGVPAFVAPIPSPAELRAFAEDAGPAMPLVFFAVFAVCAALPLPRTVFNLASGLLLGNALGILVAMAATTAAAVLGFTAARLLGGDLVPRHADRRAVRTVDQRISGGGMLGITSLRLIPVIPFALLSYCCGLSSTRRRDYVAGTVVGSLPGTAAVVILGDALTGTTPPALVACYVAFALVGAIGVYRLVRRPALARTRGPGTAAVVAAIGHDETRQYTRSGS
ncbi:MAG: TVP38/TMEM64 family protein [Haloechinothrix sp.]